MRWMIAWASVLIAICPLPVVADTLIRPDRVILMDLTNSGNALVAVGERGTVLRSGDRGETWQVCATPTTRTLTAIAFSSSMVAVAVGHGGTLLRSEDGGRLWTALPTPDPNRNSILGVTAAGAGRFVAYGSFGLMLVSEDDGKTWVRKEVLGPDFDRHIYGILPLSPEHWLLVGESGTLAASSDAGNTWQALPSPYEGSLFGAIRSASGAVVAFGMRGNVFRSTDDGLHWAKSESHTLTGFNNGRPMANGRIVLVGNNGVVAQSLDDGVSFHATTINGTANYAQTTMVDGALILAGDNGISRIQSLPGNDRHD